jgi:hypothetical protein
MCSNSSNKGKQAETIRDQCTVKTRKHKQTERTSRMPMTLEIRNWRTPLKQNEVKTSIQRFLVYKSFCVEMFDF